MKPTSLKAHTGLTGFARLALMPFALSLLAASSYAQASPAPAKNWEAQPYQTLYLTNLTQQNDANDIVTALRNMLPQARIYFVPSQSAISFRGSPEDLQVAQKLLSDLDRIEKTYRLTYTITESDSGKRIGVQHFALIVVSGQKTELKQGSKIPVVTGEVHTDNAAQSSEVQYLDIGLNIEASIDSFLDGVRLRTKVEQSTLAEERSGVGVQDPIIRQATLEGTSTLVQGKPLVLGSLDIPGTTRHQDIEVISERVR